MAMEMTRRAAMLASASAASLGVVGRALAEDTIKIGQLVPLTGASAESGRFEVNGAKLALETVNAQGRALGHRVELVIEDSQSTNPGTVLAFSRLASRGDLVGYFSGTTSTQTHALAPDALKAGRPVMILATDPKLTHMGHPWLFRCRPNDSYSARVIADFGAKELKKQKWVIVHSTDAFGVAGMKTLVDALGAFNIKPVLVQGYTNQQPDFTPLAIAVKQADADVMASYTTFDADVALLARQIHDLGVRLPWIGSPTIASTSAIKLAGRALSGTYGVVDFAAAANPEGRAFADRYEQVYGTRADFYSATLFDGSATLFDGVTILARAINEAKSTDPEKMRQAILAIRGFKGAEGEYNFDANGDGLHGYNIVRNDNGAIVFDRHIEFTD
jgi:branched-chain amino acid transport system substrate-binding protein